MKIFREEDRDTHLANAAYFTGRVFHDQIIEAEEPARVRALKVSFEPKARTAWHTHPLGQTLYILEGVGLVGLRHQKVQKVRAGDTVWIPPKEEHWHGATPEKRMVHIAIQEQLGGAVSNWLEHVTDTDYYFARN